MRHIIKDVLIEEGLLPGMHIRDKGDQKSQAMREVNQRRQRFTLSRKPADRAAKAEMQRQQWAELEQRALEVDRMLEEGARQEGESDESNNNKSSKRNAKKQNRDKSRN